MALVSRRWARITPTIKIHEEGLITSHPLLLHRLLSFVTENPANKRSFPFPRPKSISVLLSHKPFKAIATGKNVACCLALPNHPLINKVSTVDPSRRLPSVKPS